MVTDESYRLIQQSLERLTRAVEESNKLKAASKRESAPNLAKAKKLAQDTTETGKTTKQSALGDPSAWSNLASMIGDAIGKSISAAITDIEKKKDEIVDAKLNDPKKFIVQAMEDDARRGITWSREDIHQARRQLADPNMAALLARRQAEVEFSGTGFLGRLSENIMGTNLPQQFERFKQAGSRVWAGIWDTSNVDYHDKYSKAPVITARGAVQGE